MLLLMQPELALTIFFFADSIFHLWSTMILQSFSHILLPWQISLNLALLFLSDYLAMEPYLASKQVQGTCSTTLTSTFEEDRSPPASPGHSLKKQEKSSSGELGEHKGGWKVSCGILETLPRYTEHGGSMLWERLGQSSMADAWCPKLQSGEYDFGLHKLLVKCLVFYTTTEFPCSSSCIYQGLYGSYFHSATSLHSTT